MKLLIDGTAYEYRADKMAMSEAIEMEERTGLGLISFEAAWDDFKPVALKWVAYLAKQRAGETVDWESFSFDLAAMMKDLMSAVGAAPDAVDPTKPVSPPSETPPDAPEPA